MKLAAIVFALVLLSSVLAQAPQEAPAASPHQAGQPAPPATSPTQSQAHSPSDDNHPADTAPRQYIEFWNTGDPKVLKSFFAPFYMFSHGHRVIVDDVMLTRVVNAWRESMPDLNFKIEDTITQDNKVSMRLTFTGTYKVRLFPNTADPAKLTPPRHVHATELLFFELKEGRIRTIWEEYDELAMRTQMGGRWLTNDQLDAALKSTSTPGSKPPAPPPKP